jgi:hypothetical protein
MTREELIKEIEKDPSTVATGLAYFVTLPEGKEVLENYAKQEAPKLVEAAKADIFKSVETKLATIVGTSKPEGIAFDVYVEGIGKELKKLKEDAGKNGDEASKTRIKELETELQGVKAANWEGKYNSLAAETSVKLEEYNTKLSDLEKGNKEGMVGNELTAAYSKLAFNPNIPKEAIEALASRAKESALKNAKVVEGKVVYYNEDGTPMLNELFKPITAEEIYRKNMASVLAAGGGGGKAPGTAGTPTGTEGKKGSVVSITEGDKVVKKLSLDPTQFNTKLTFAQHAEEVLIAEGVEKGSKEATEMIMAARTEYGVDKMDRV